MEYLAFWPRWWPVGEQLFEPVTQLVQAGAQIPQSWCWAAFLRRLPAWVALSAGGFQREAVAAAKPVPRIVSVAARSPSRSPAGDVPAMEDASLEVQSLDRRSPCSKIAHARAWRSTPLCSGATGHAD